MYITKNALDEIKRNGKFLKIIVEAGGCAGFEYILSYTNEVEEGFAIQEVGLITEFNHDKTHNEVKEKFSVILTDEISLNLLKDIIIDYTVEIGFENFNIFNPNVKKSCNCGSSFG